MTFTDAFWKWFGDSKIVDGRGNPKVMYHGGGFEEDDPQGIRVSGFGAHFGTQKSAETRMWTQHIDQEIEDAPIWEENGRYFLDEDMWPSQPERGFKTEEQAKDYIANQMQYSEGPDDVYLTEAFLRIENPLELPDLGTWSFAGVIRELREQRIFTASDADKVYTAYNLSDARGWNMVKALLRRKGFDGIKYLNAVEDRGKYSYIIFKPQQAKSVNNRGTWSPRDPSMMNPQRKTSSKLPCLRTMYNEAKVGDITVIQSGSMVFIDDFDFVEDFRTMPQAEDFFTALIVGAHHEYTENRVKPYAAALMTALDNVENASDYYFVNQAPLSNPPPQYNFIRLYSHKLMAYIDYRKHPTRKGYVTKQKFEGDGRRWGPVTGKKSMTSKAATKEIRRLESRGLWKIVRANPEIIRPGPTFFRDHAQMRKVQEEVYEMTGRWFSPAQINEFLRNALVNKLRKQIRVVK